MYHPSSSHLFLRVATWSVFLAEVSPLHSPSLTTSWRTRNWKLLTRLRACFPSKTISSLGTGRAFFFFFLSNHNHDYYHPKPSKSQTHISLLKCSSNIKLQDLYQRRGLVWLWYSSSYPPPTSSHGGTHCSRAEVRPLAECREGSYATSPCICFWHQMGTKKHETEGGCMVDSHDEQCLFSWFSRRIRTILCLLFNNIFCIQVWLSMDLFYPLLLPRKIC